MCGWSERMKENATRKMLSKGPTANDTIRLSLDRQLHRRSCLEASFIALIYKKLASYTPVTAEVIKKKRKTSDRANPHVCRPVVRRAGRRSRLHPAWP
jgi:hypothetical protein